LSISIYGRFELLWGGGVLPSFAAVLVEEVFPSTWLWFCPPAGHLPPASRWDLAGCQVDPAVPKAHDPAATAAVAAAAAGAHGQWVLLHPVGWHTDATAPPG